MQFNAITIYGDGFLEKYFYSFQDAALDAYISSHLDFHSLSFTYSKQHTFSKPSLCLPHKKSFYRITQPPSSTPSLTNPIFPPPIIHPIPNHPHLPTPLPHLPHPQPTPPSTTLLMPLSSHNQHNKSHLPTPFLIQTLLIPHTIHIQTPLVERQSY